MKTLLLLLCLASAALAAEPEWQVIDEGFLFSLPRDWKKEEVRGIDSHVGKYVGKTAYLEFDGVYGLGLTVEETASRIEELKKKEAKPALLKKDEEVWRVDGRIARFEFGKIDPKRFGTREYQNFAHLHIPIEGDPAYLTIYVFYASESDLPTVRRILKSVRWPKKSPTSR